MLTGRLAKTELLIAEAAKYAKMGDEIWTLTYLRSAISLLEAVRNPVGGRERTTQMNDKEIAEAQALIDSVTQGTGKLEPVKAVFPEPDTRKPIDKLLGVIRAWIETESGPTMMKFSHPELKVQVTIRGYKKIILERKSR